LPQFVEHSHRTEANVVDVLLALNQVGSSAESVSRYVKNVGGRGREGFRWKVENFPLDKSHKSGVQTKKGEVKATITLSNKSFDQVFEEQAEAALADEGDDNPPIIEAPKHIPGFLPTFPTERTYKSTEVERKVEANDHKQWLQVQEQKQEAEKAVLNLGSRVSEEQKRRSEPSGAGVIGSEPSGNGTAEGSVEGFLPKQFSAVLDKAAERMPDRVTRGRKRSAGRPADPPRARAIKSSALHGHPHKLSDLDATQIKQSLHLSGTGFSSLKDSVILGSDQIVSKQARAKWQDFQKGGWGSKQSRRSDMGNIDLAEREKIDRAQTILLRGVEAAAEDELL